MEVGGILRFQANGFSIIRQGIPVAAQLEGRVATVKEHLEMTRRFKIHPGEHFKSEGMWMVYIYIYIEWLSTCRILDGTSGMAVDLILVVLNSAVCERCKFLRGRLRHSQAQPAARHAGDWMDSWKAGLFTEKKNRLSANSGIPCSILANCGKLVLDLQVGHAETPLHLQSCSKIFRCFSVPQTLLGFRQVTWNQRPPSYGSYGIMGAGLLKVVARQTAVVQIPA